MIATSQRQPDQRHRPSVPELPLTVTVDCFTERDGRAIHHPVTINTDFTITTPHDIEAERIGVGLGGHSSCVQLVDRAAPALRGLWLQRHRLAPAAIRPLRGRWDWAVDWEPLWTAPTSGRCPSCSEKDLAHQVAHHLREVQHWARLHRLSTEYAAILHRVVPNPRPPSPWPNRAAVPNSEGWRWLWLAGAHPHDVVRIHTALGIRGPLPARAYLHILSEDLDLGWLAQFVPAGAAEVAWAAITHTDADLDRPEARRRWRDTGLAPRLIPPLLNGPYTPTEVGWLASTLNVGQDAAGRLLARWSSLEATTPSVADIARVWSRLPQAVVPMQADLDATWDEAARIPGIGSITREQVGILLAATANPHETITLVRAGVRSLAGIRKARMRPA